MTREVEATLTDEHLESLVLKAHALGVTPDELIESIVGKFLDMTNNVDVSRRLDLPKIGPNSRY